MIDLHEYGWSDELEQHCQSRSAPDVVPGRVVAEHRDLYGVQTAFGDVSAGIAGRLRYQAENRGDLPAVGDWVLLDAGEPGGVAVIREVLPRRSRFSRKVAGERTEEQIVAANIDVVWVASALDQPLSLRRIERYLALAWESGAMPVILLTKADLAEDSESRRAEVESIAFGVPIHVVSSVSGEGLDALEAYFRNRQTVALLGPSGVGKSTLINRLAGEEILRVGGVRESDHKGRHTTTHRQLIRLPGGGMIVDTPGMCELQLWGVDEGIQDTFGDIEELAASCRFADCRHAGEPGCAVEAAVAQGRLDPERLESYHKLERERKYLERRHDARAQAEANRRLRPLMKLQRQHPKYRGGES